ncbi:probable TVP38/TMEM64 family membrane protein Mb1528c [Coccomyxa sp. Obi]|nr:probable TVP38/TMEM64 family membrane protein Mb1528c [Coccomyxa sp. Obi]
MEAYVRSSGTLSCSGSHLSQDFRALYMHPGYRSGFAAVSIAALLHPSDAHAAELVPIDLFSSFLDKVHELGPLGPALFVFTVVGCEMIPLFPTQPLALASGLLFGPIEGAVCITFATTLAASIAFYLSQGLGRQLAERIINSEVGGESSDKGNAAQQALARVQSSVEKGGFWQQYSAVLALRMTPVVPFSASSYLLGLSSLPFRPFFVGTLSAMAVWGPLYATIGGASRELLQNGGNLGEVLSDLQARTGQYTEKAAVVGLVVGVITLGLWSTGVLKSANSQPRQ